MIGSIMTDDWLLNSEQPEINSDVVDKYRCHQDMKMECGISQTAVANNIRRLKRNCAAGIDGVTTEHMLYALSATFCTELMNLYSTMFKRNVIPDLLKIGVIVPILKQGKSEGFDSCDRPSNLTQTGFKSSIFQPVWPWYLMDDPKKQ